MTEKRAAGVLMPIFSLPSGYSSGNFGRSAYAFVDLLKESGFSYWQVLPFTVPDAFYSPYASPSSFSLNPYFLDPWDLVRRGLLYEEELPRTREHVAQICEYEWLEATRLPLLRLAARRFTDNAALDDFLHAHPYIEEYCRFEGLKAANGGAPWQDFTCKTPDAETYRTTAVIAYLFFEEWRALRAYANGKGISVIGDLPIYVSLESADVFFHPELFELEEDGTPRGVAGVPPDYFSDVGQKWGNPLYDWERMKAEDFRFWRARIRHMLDLFDGVRLDHFRGFDTYFDIPVYAPTAAGGVWREGPRFDLIDALKEEAGRALLIAEDLGELFPSVEKLLSYSGFPGMRVLSFGVDGEDSPHHPRNYPKNAVAYSGTHDNDTLMGFFSSVSDEKRLAFCHGLGVEGREPRDASCAAIEALYASRADLVILPVQDLLLLESDARFNTPGRAEGNWRFRITEGQMCAIDKNYFCDLAKRFER